MCSHEESFGIVLLEAGSAGLPLFAFDSAQGSKEIIKNGENGYLIKNRNKQEMALMIQKIVDNETEIKRMGEKSKKMIKPYKFDNVKKIWVNFFEEIL